MEGTTFVIDNGACRCRIGVAGDAMPRATFQNAVAKPKSDARLVVGIEIDEARSINQLNFRRPFDRGYVINWSLQGNIWSRMLDQLMPQVCPLQ
jgi:actin-related protein 6